IFNLLAKLNPWRRRSEFIEAFSTPNAGVPWVDGSYNFPSLWKWEAGKLTNNSTAEREYPYFHFFGWKKDIWVNGATFQEVDSNCNLFTLTESGISAGKKTI